MDEQESNNLAEKILSFDDSIYSVGVVSHSGQALGSATKPSFRKQFGNEPKWGEGAFSKYWGTEAFRAATIFASAKTDENLLTPLESIALVRESLKVILFTLIPKYPVIVGLVTSKTLDEVEIVPKLLSFLK
jgi:hypothetical protein